MLPSKRTIIAAVSALVVWTAGAGVCAAQTWGYAVYADLAWWDGVVYSSAEGYDYADPPVQHWGQNLQSALYSPSRSAYGTTGMSLSFDNEFGDWSTVATYAFWCSSAGGITAENYMVLDLSYPPQSGGAPNPQQLQACLNSCKQGITAIENFCRSLPPYPPALRAACWAARWSVTACEGFCYWWFS